MNGGTPEVSRGKRRAASAVMPASHESIRFIVAVATLSQHDAGGRHVQWFQARRTRDATCRRVGLTKKREIRPFTLLFPTPWFFLPNKISPPTFMALRHQGAGGGRGERDWSDARVRNPVRRTNCRFCRVRR